MPYMLGSPSNIGPGTGLVERIQGMGCAGNCGCSKDCGGLGFFDSGTDVSGWGLAEWSTVAGLGYMLLSTIFTTKRAVSRVRAIPGERRKRRASALRKQADELTRKGGKSKKKYDD